ncbi:sce7726 family protein [Myxococcus sp. AM001]|nr:sce7726 family protein [Myxococcus sp. AM001]
MRDIDVRNALWEQLRVDVVVIDDEMHGYELKSERDTLTRLPRQVAAYGAALDRATLVVAEGHLAKASALVPEWWGLSIAHSVGGSAVRVDAHRFAARNPEQQMCSVARLLWRPDALKLLREGEDAWSAGSRPHDVLHSRRGEWRAGPGAVLLRPGCYGLRAEGP